MNRKNTTVAKLLKIITFAVFINTAFTGCTYALPASGVDTESLIIPIECYKAEESVGNIGCWEDMDDEDKSFYVKRTLSSALSFFMSGKRSPELRFMISSGWNDRLAFETMSVLAKDSYFVENVIFRTELAVREYLKRSDIIRTIILCKSGAMPCYAHRTPADPDAKDRECELYPIPSLWQITVYQALIEICSSVPLET